MQGALPGIRPCLSLSHIRHFPSTVTVLSCPDNILWSWNFLSSITFLEVAIFLIGKGIRSKTLPSRDPPKSDRRSLSGLRSCGNYSLSAALELHLSAPQFAIRPNLNQQCGWEIIKLLCMLCWALLNSHITNLISHTGKWMHLGRRRKKYGRYGAPTLNILDRVFHPNQVKDIDTLWYLIQQCFLQNRNIFWTTLPFATWRKRNFSVLFCTFRKGKVLNFFIQAVKEIALSAASK